MFNCQPRTKEVTERNSTKLCQLSECTISFERVQLLSRWANCFVQWVHATDVYKNISVRLMSTGCNQALIASGSCKVVGLTTQDMRERTSHLLTYLLTYLLIQVISIVTVFPSTCNVMR